MLRCRQKRLNSLNFIFCSWYHLVPHPLKDPVGCGLSFTQVTWFVSPPLPILCFWTGCIGQNLGQEKKSYGDVPAGQPDGRPALFGEKFIAESIGGAVKVFSWRSSNQSIVRPRPSAGPPDFPVGFPVKESAFLPSFYPIVVVGTCRSTLNNKPDVPYQLVRSVATRTTPTGRWKLDIAAAASATAAGFLVESRVSSGGRSVIRGETSARGSPTKRRRECSDEVRYLIPLQKLMLDLFYSITYMCKM